MKTFCRLCEVNCGLEATVDAEGRLAALAPDETHPVTQGFACHKGLLARDIHHDPDRVDAPQRRIANGFESATWDAAIASIASELTRILHTYGPNAIGTYLGNPFAFNAMGSMAAGMFPAVLGSDRTFHSGTQDCANKFALGEILYGSAQIHPIPAPTCP